MRKLIVGSQARAQGMTGHELWRWHDRMFRDIYLPRGYMPALDERIDGAWLRSGCQGVVAGLAAAALHGARWIDDDIPIELIWDTCRPPPGIVARRERLAPDEITVADAISVTTPARTAYDLGRHRPRADALGRLDALKRSTAFQEDEVLALTQRYRGARGLKQLRALLPLVDAGAASLQESRLRLLFVDAGFPVPTTQIALLNGWRVFRTLDMGWEEFMVAAEYDGDQHRTNRRQYIKDQRMLPVIQRLGWTVQRVIKEDRDEEILEYAYRALMAHGWDGRLRQPTRALAPIAAKLQLLRPSLALSRDNRNLAG